MLCTVYGVQCSHKHSSTQTGCLYTVYHTVHAQHPAVSSICASLPVVGWHYTLLVYNGKLLLMQTAQQFCMTHMQLVIFSLLSDDITTMLLIVGCRQ